MERTNTGPRSAGRWALLLLAALALGVSPVHPATVRGTVSSSQGPLEEMVVSAWGTSGTLEASASTDHTGHYEMSAPAGQYRILAYDPQGVWATAFDGGADSFESSPQVNLGAASTITRDFQLQKAGFISGTVRAGGTGRQDITIAVYNLSGTRRSTTRSGSGGHYSVALPPGQYKLAVWDDQVGLATVFYPDTPWFEDAAILTVSSGTTSTGRDFAMQPVASLSGTITEAGTARPLFNVLVYAYGSGGRAIAVTTTRSDGSFDLTVPAGTWRLVSTDPGETYATDYYGNAITFANSPGVSVGAGQRRDHLDFTMARGGTVTGQVQSSTGLTLAGIHVVGYNPDGTPRAETTSNSSGNYELILPPGPFRLAAFDLQFTFATEFYDQSSVFETATPITITAGVIVPGIDFRLPRAAKITGTVLDGQKQTPVPGLTVSARDSNGYRTGAAITDAKGHFTLVLVPGSYRVLVSDPARLYANAFDSASHNFESTPERSVSAGTSQIANFSVMRGIPLTGRCVTSGLIPVAGIQVSVLDPAGNHIVESTSGGDGSFLVPLLPGSYILELQDPQNRYRTSFYAQARELSEATSFEISAPTAPPPLEVILLPAGHRRHLVHR